MMQSGCKFAIFFLTFFIAGLLLGQKGIAQTVYSCQYKSDADVKVYVTEYKSDADLVVYKCQYKSDASGNEGLWYFTTYKSDARKKIYFVSYKSDADIIVYFSQYKSDAGWKKKEKQHFLY